MMKKIFVVYFTTLTKGKKAKIKCYITLFTTIKVALFISEVFPQILTGS